MFYEILDKNRQEILPLLKAFKAEFYLAGGTALALHLGHRDSIDFDFFRQADFDTSRLFDRIREIFQGRNLVNIQEEKNTLTVLLDRDIKISFFTYKYELIGEKIDEDNLLLASIEDIACMKLSAILGRAANKDYIDLFFILKKFDLKKLIGLAEKKFPQIDTNLILKSLVYFDDVALEPILFKNSSDVDFTEVKSFLVAQVKSFSAYL